MNIKSIGFFIAALSSNVSWSLPAPQYLSVNKWKSCVETVTKGEARFVCLPSKKPQACPTTSWKRLVKNHLIPSC
jgi:hypothetical protein